MLKKSQISIFHVCVNNRMSYWSRISEGPKSWMIWLSIPCLFCRITAYFFDVNNETRFSRVLWQIFWSREKKKKIKKKNHLISLIEWFYMKISSDKTFMILLWRKSSLITNLSVSLPTVPRGIHRRFLACFWSNHWKKKSFCFMARSSKIILEVPWRAIDWMQIEEIRNT